MQPAWLCMSKWILHSATRRPFRFRLSCPPLPAPAGRTFIHDFHPRGRSAALVFAVVLATQALVQQGPAAAPQAPARRHRRRLPASAARHRPPGQGRGGGRGNATAALYTERCAGCHGVDQSGGRAPSLFDDTWVHGSDDESIAKMITNGVPNTEMVAFKDSAHRAADLAAGRISADAGARTSRTSRSTCRIPTGR